jgi:hypothetical protein
LSSPADLALVGLRQLCGFGGDADGKMAAVHCGDQFRLPWFKTTLPICPWRAGRHASADRTAPSSA